MSVVVPVARPITLAVSEAVTAASSILDPTDLFFSGETGTFLDFTTPQVYADTAGTDPAEVGEGIAFVDDKSPNDTDATQATSTARPIFARVPRGGRRNLLTQTENLAASPWDTVFASDTVIGAVTDGFTEIEFTATSADRRLPRTQVIETVPSGEVRYVRALFKPGAGCTTIALGGNAGPNKFGWVAYNIISGVSTSYIISDSVVVPTELVSAEEVFLGTWELVVKITAGNSTITQIHAHFGDGTAQQLRTASPIASCELGFIAATKEWPTPYQKVTTQYDITEAGIPSVYHSVWDNTDDILPITLPAITGGTVALVGLNGIWIEEDWDYAGGTLSIGPTTIAGLPAGILDVVGDLCAVIINDRAWTAAERAGVVAWGKARGAPGVFGLGPELVTNGTFDTDLSGWTLGSAPAWNAAGYAELSSGAFINQSFAVQLGSPYLFEQLNRPESVSTNQSFIGSTLGTSDLVPLVSVAIGTIRRATFTATTTSAFPWIRNLNAGIAGVDNISVRKLELIP